MYKISVVIPTYNRKQLLPRALDSVLDQSRPVDEIIVVDDGSSDGTDSFITSHYPDITFIRQENRGVSHARNTGIRKASHPWIALLDSDDQWLPEKTKVQIDELKHAPDKKIVHSDEIWIRNGKRVNAMNKHRKQGGWIYPACLPLCVISPSSVMIHRDVFEITGLFDEELPACEDYDLWLRICARYPVAYIDRPMIRKYGGHSDQLSRTHWGMDRFRIHALQKMLASDLLDKKLQVSTENMLVEKARIMANGAAKRGKQNEAAKYRALVEQFIPVTPNQVTA